MMSRILIWTMLSRPLSWTMIWTWTPSYLALIVLALLAKVSSFAPVLWRVMVAAEQSYAAHVCHPNYALFKPCQRCRIVSCMPGMLLACDCYVQDSSQLRDQLQLLILCYKVCHMALR